MHAFLRAYFVTSVIFTLFLVGLTAAIDKASAQTIYPNRGGTGTTTIPTLGQVLVGQSNGTYAPQATSTLGISGGGSGSVATSTFRTMFSAASPLSYSTSTGEFTLGTVDISSNTNLTVTATGLQLTGDAVALASGYSIPLTASTTNWQTAYGWGNHASAGYLTTESDPIFGASDAAGITSTDIANWDTAFGWGDHGAEGYLTAIATSSVRGMFSASSPLSYNSGTGAFTFTNPGYVTGNEQITLSGDASGSGTTSIAVTVANDSHTHTGSTLSGIDISSDTNLGGDSEIVLTGDTLSIASSIARDSELHSAVTLAGEDYLSLSTQQITADAIDPDNLSASDFGLFTCNGTTCSIDANTVALTTNTTGNYVQSIADDGQGTVTVTNGTAEGGAVTLRVIDVVCADCLGPTEITDSYILNTGDTLSGILTVTGTTTLATTTLGGALTFDGVTGSTWSDFCVAITGSADLCDGSDDGGGGGGGNVSNTGSPFNNQLAVWTNSTTIEGVPALTYDGTTLTVSATSSLATTTISTLDVLAAFNADTATALAANGADCLSGSAPLGVDASGVVESCFDVWTESENTAAAYISGVDWGDIGGTLTDQTDLQSALNAKQDTLTTGNLTENVTGLEFDATRAVIGGAAQLSLSSGYVIPLSASTTEWATAYASTTALTPAYIRGLLSGTSPLSYNSGTGAFSISNDGIGDTQLAFNTGQHLTTTSVPIFASSTFSNLTSALLQTTAGGLLAEYAGTSCTNQFVRSLSALGIATCATVGTADVSGLDISDDTNLTAGDALTLTGDDIDFDGGATPGGVLGGTWASPTLDDNYLLNTGDTATGDYTFDTSTFFLNSTTNRVGIGTTTPLAALHVASSTNSTTTLQIGSIGSVGCLAIRDRDNAGWTYVLALDGALLASTTPCE